MNDITCDVCRDLMPLVKDGIASADSRAAVERHLESCPSCRARFEKPLPAGGEKAFAALWNRLRLFAALVMMLCIFVGMDLTGGQGLFYNSLLMPFIGALGFLVFRWKAAYNIPLLLLAVGLVTCGLNLLLECEHGAVYTVCRTEAKAGKNEHGGYLLLLHTVLFTCEVYCNDDRGDGNEIECDPEWSAPGIIPTHDERGDDGDYDATGEIEHHYDRIWAGLRRFYKEEIIREECRCIHRTDENTPRVEGKLHFRKEKEGYDNDEQTRNYRKDRRGHVAVSGIFICIKLGQKRL